MTHVRSAFPFLVLIIAALAFAGCAQTDEISEVAEQADAGLGTAQYFQQIQVPLQKYGPIVSNAPLQGPHNEAQVAGLTDAATKMRALKKELEAVDPADEYEQAHKDLIASVEESAVAFDNLAAAAKAKDDQK